MVESKEDLKRSRLLINAIVKGKAFQIDMATKDLTEVMIEGVEQFQNAGFRYAETKSGRTFILS